MLAVGVPMTVALLLPAIRDRIPRKVNRRKIADLSPVGLRGSSV
jgi:hypothetical protein